jgi:hypothetical protein
MFYNKLPKDSLGQKYIIRSACCLQVVLFMGVDKKIFLCSKCERVLIESEIKVFTELKPKQNIIEGVIGSIP